jgi:chromosomal replication initiator protein
MASEDTSLAEQQVFSFPPSPEYFFSNFIQYEESEFAYQSAENLCKLNSICNTLFISGDQGLGKTHLLKAIGNQIQQSNSSKKVIYSKCGDLITKLNTKKNNSENIVNQILNADIFLLDDLDDLKNNLNFQKTLYHIFNTLKEKEKKIAFAGKTSPSQLKGTADYLVSRFSWGIIAPIGPMNDQAGCKLIQKMALDFGLEISDVVAKFIIVRIPRDFTSLKNAVALINNESYVQKRKVTIPLTKTALKID